MMRAKTWVAFLSIVVVGAAAPFAVAQEKGATAFRPPASALEILRKFDIGDSQFASFFSGQPLGPAEEEVIAKILYRWPRLGAENVQRWRTKGGSWDQVVAQPVEHRGEIHFLRGRVTHVAKIALLPEAAERLEFDHYFVATIKIADSPAVATVYARFIPSAWKLDAEINEPVTVDGLFLKVGDATADSPPLIFVAERVAWHPDKPHPEAGVGPDQVVLAQAGVDWGLYEAVKAENGRVLGKADSEPFFQTLSVFAGDKAKFPAAQKQIDIPLLLQKSEALLGSRMKFEGTAWRIVKVSVEDADFRKRFGIDHYYEIDATILLDKPIKVAKNPGDKEAVLYANDFPVVLLVLQLPANLQEGENLKDAISAEGTFYRLWTYQSSYAGQKNKRQAAPLLMSSEVHLVKKGNPLTAFSGAIATTAMVLACGTFFVIYWWFRLTDKKSAARPSATIQDAIRKGAEERISEKPNFEGL